MVTNILINPGKSIAKLCRQDFFSFTEEFWDQIIPEEPVWNWHIPYLCSELQVVAERVFKSRPKLYDLIINIPPGTTKSTICSVMYPAWIWTRMRHARFAGASYTISLALELALKTRDIVTCEKYQRLFPEVGPLRDDQKAKGNFKNHHGGQRFAIGQGGMITGQHFHFISIDDPIDPLRANLMSGKDLEEVNGWIQDTLGKRKVNKKVTVTSLVMQRLHQNDPTGHRLAQPKKTGPVRHICLPGEATKKIRPRHLRKNYKNGLLDPVRLPREVLEEEQAISAYTYASQFLQDPIPLGGGMFKTDRLQYGPRPNWRDLKRVCWFIDKAATDGSGAYSVMLKMAEDKETILDGKNQFGRFWVLQVIRGQWGLYDREKIFRETMERDLPSDNEVQIRQYLAKLEGGVEQEPGSGGKDSVQVTLRNLTGWNFSEDLPTGSKVARAEGFATQVNAGNVWLPEGAEWIPEYLDELRFFPFSTYKDQVDASSGAFNKLFRPRKRVGALR